MNDLIAVTSSSSQTDGLIAVTSKEEKPNKLIFTGIVKFETKNDQILQIKSADINISEAVYKKIVKEFEQVIIIIMDNSES